MKSTKARLRLAGERRQVTALFYDIVGSTEILVRGDPERFLQAVNKLHRAAQAIVGRHGGFLHKRLGDGGCCFFGYPEQTEDAAESAVAAALELIDAARKRTSKEDEPFQLRVGIATSLVVFSSDNEEVVGTAPILASRLQAEAEPNTVAVADTTYQLTRTRFAYSQIGEARLKGFEAPIGLWRPEGRTQAMARTPFLSVPLRPMTGRERELALLLEAWNSTRQGTGASFAIIGEAGIGKSRLVSELRQSVEGGGLVFQCNRRFEGNPFHPFIGFLEGLVEGTVLKSGNATMICDALREAGIDVDADVARTVSAFAFERQGSTAANIRVTDLTGRVFRTQVIDAAVQILCGRSTAQPALFVFEDVHWADEMTMELVAALCELSTSRPILLVQTSRTRREEAHATPMALSGLPSGAIRDLVTSIWGGPPPEGLANFILEQCDGMPLYAEELVHFFQERHSDGRPVSEWRELLLEGGVSSLNDLLSTRLAGAGAARRIAQFASVIGREFTTDLLSNLLDAPDRDGLAAHLDVLAAHGIVEPASGQADTFQFHHVLLQEAAYGSLLKSDRQRIHGRIAKLLIEERVMPLPAAVAAWQCAEAGRHGDAASFALQAVEACVVRSAMKEATLSLELCEREISSVSRRHPHRRELTLGMLQLRGVVAAALEGEGSETARKTYSRAMQILRRQQSVRREAHFPTYWGWWFTAPDIRTQQSRARILVEDMMMVNDPETRLQSYHCAWATGFHAGEHGFCLDCVEKGLDLYDEDRAVRYRAFFGGHDAKVCGLGESALSYLIVGQPEESEVAISRSLDHAAATDHVGSLVHSLYYAIVLRRCQHRFDDVIRLGEQMLSLAEKHGLVASQARANMYCGWAELMASSAAAGVSRFQQGLAMQQRSGTDDNLSIHSDMHSEVLQRSGRPLEALSVLNNAIRVGKKSGQLFWLAELYRRRAELRLELDDKLPRVRNDLSRALRIASAQGAGWLLDRAKQDMRRLD